MTGSRPLPRLLAAVALTALGLAAAGCAGDDPPPAASGGTPATSTASPLPEGSARGAPVVRGPIELLTGGTLPAARLRGRVVLVVNTASKCGFTPQFEGLEALDEERGDEGLTVVGFPSDDFRQELDDAAEIAAFCELNYGVGFPMAAPGRVTAPRAQPVFAAIAARGGPAGAEPDWNFTKYLLDRRGRLVARFASSVEPDDPAITGAIDRLLAEPGDL